MIRKFAAAVIAASILQGCATQSDTQNISPHFNYNKDVKIGLEAESIGNWALARDFLERALQKDDQYRINTVYEDDPVLTEEVREDAIFALSRIYYTTGDKDALYKHLHQYWKVDGFESIPWVSEEQEQANLRYHLTWYCRLLDDHDRFSEAQACWAKLGNDERARASIRAFELKEVFVRQ